MNELIFYDISSEQAMNLLPAQVQSLPLSPLYLAVKSGDLGTGLELIKKASIEQRSALLDIDLWAKDEVSIESFLFWVQAYSVLKTDNPVLALEFCLSEQFQLFLKSKLNIYTFDIEDPQYPDHDNYFLTEDNLLLFEYDEAFTYVDEVKEMIFLLYSEMGVEKAYTYIFKTVAEDYSNYMEYSYLSKKKRLENLGYVDYYDTLKYETPLRNIGLVDSFILGRNPEKLKLEPKNNAQEIKTPVILEHDILKQALRSITDKARREYLDLSLINALNNSLSFQQSLSKGKVATKNVSLRTMNRIRLGFEYASRKRKNVLELLDFRDLYLVGHSLVRIEQGKLKKYETAVYLSKNFIGDYWYSFYEASLVDSIIRFSSLDNNSNEVNSYESYLNWSFYIKEFISFCKFFEAFYGTLEKMKSSGDIANTYYANYNVEEIDFETLLLSCFANFANGSLDSQEDGKKLGITIEEYKILLTKTLGESKLSLINDFCEAFGLSGLKFSADYVSYLLNFHLSGYSLDDINDEQAKYLGGPLILNIH